MTCNECVHFNVCYKKDWIITHEHAEKDCHDYRSDSFDYGYAQGYVDGMTGAEWKGENE